MGREKLAGKTALVTGASSGIGLEFAFKTNLNVKVDWGFALEELDGQVSSGSSQVHIVASIFF